MQNAKLTGERARGRAGFSLLEMLIVLAVMMCLTAVAIPSMLNVVATFRLRTAMGELSGLTQTCRTEAVKRNATQWLRFKVISGRLVAFVAAAGSDEAADPPARTAQVWLPLPLSKVAAPSGEEGAPPEVAVADLWGGDIDPQKTADTYFNPRGLPCNMDDGVCSPTSGFIYYFTYNRSIGSPSWAALSISPAGRIKAWYWNGTSWGD